MGDPIFPEEILIEIFSKLPSKSVGKCKCLSKFWHSFLSTPHFTTLYLSLNLNLCSTHNNQIHNLIMITPSHSLHLLTPTIHNNQFTVSRKLEFPNSWTQLIGSCNGFVLLANNESELYLLNPVTFRMVKIPRFDLALVKCETTVISHGFGYDSSTNDYKVVTLSCTKGMQMQYVDVYSVKKGVWKRIECVNFLVFVHSDHLNATGVFVNGALHWQALSTKAPEFIIAAFDLANEAFSEIVIPSTMVHVLSKRLLVCEGCLCGVSLISFIRGEVEGYHVWTMKEYGSLESSTEFEIPEKVNWPLCFVGEERLVFSTFGGGVFVYDVKEGKVKEFIVDGVPAHCKDMDNLVTNLA